MSGSVGSLVMRNGYKPAHRERTVSRFREVLPQVLATCASNMVMLNLTLTLSFSTIVIAALHHAEGELSLDDTQASWFGSLLFICQPLGSVASGVIVDVLGRKRSLILINLPYLLSCILIATSNSVPMLFCANVLIGVTIGLTEAPMNSYFGEICQPELRGILASCAALYYQLGILLEYTMGSLLHWRTAAGVSAAFPSMGIILIFLVPESPIWLVAKDRERDAEKALCWLRGWVVPEAVSQELQELTRYHKEMTLKQLEPVPLQDMKGSHPEMLGLLPTDSKFQQEPESSKPNRIVEKIREILKPPTRRPLLLIFLMFFFVGFSGMVSIRPFLVEVFDHFHAGMDSKWATVVTAAGGLTGSVILVTCMSLVGKRPLALISTALCGLCCVGLGAYAIVMKDKEHTATWIPVVLIVLLSLGNMVQSHIPWLLICETFPYRTRGVAGGIGAASCYVVWFTATRTYLRMEHSLELHGAFWVFGAISVIGFVFMYFRLPETEGKTLEDIERYFSRGSMMNGCQAARQSRTVSRFREVLPQVMATSAANLVVLNLTLTMSFGTIVIADLHHSEGELSMDDTQASWFGSLLFMCQPLGSIASGIIVDTVGRKRSLMLINVPYLISCILIATATSVPMLFFTSVLIGITIGLTESPINSYFGEVSQPELRGVLASCAALFYQFGMFLEFMMGSLMSWRTTAAVSAVFPAATILLFWLVPESPIWLVAKDREKDAENALCWLRGWVAPEAVSQELQELKRYHKEVTLKQLEPVPLQNMKTSHPELLGLLPTDRKFHQEQPQQPGRLEFAKEILKPPTRRPLLLIFLMFFFVGFSGMASIRPFLVEVFDNFHAGMDSKWATVLSAAAGFLGSIILVCCMSLLGKRPLALVSTAACALSCIALGTYAFVMQGREHTATWIPVVLIALLALGNMVQSQIPWLLICETFPYRTRGVAGGIAAASCYVVWFFASKTYLAMEHALQLHGVFWVFGAVSIVGLFFMYWRLPETEGKSLQDIERIFSQ